MRLSQSTCVLPWTSERLHLVPTCCREQAVFAELQVVDLIAAPSPTATLPPPATAAATATHTHDSLSNSKLPADLRSQEIVRAAKTRFHEPRNTTATAAPTPGGCQIGCAGLEQTGKIHSASAQEPHSLDRTIGSKDVCHSSVHQKVIAGSEKLMIFLQRRASRDLAQRPMLIVMS
jgi:hypothetical protein